MTVTKVLGVAGRAFLFAGFILLAFALHQLWGTGLQEARAQDDLREEFRAAVPEHRDRPPTPASAPEATTTTALPFTPVPGDAVAILRIPRIGVDKAVVEGVSRSDLRQGPGHYPGTPLPGQPGNAAIAGHRTTYGAPFYRLNELSNDDTITVVTREAVYTYTVTRTAIVRPTDTQVLDNVIGPDDKPKATITLTTCHPRYSARQRLIVFGDLTFTSTNTGKVAA
jgi:sortase A